MALGLALGALGVLGACDTQSSTTDDATCTQLFGVPDANTGLDATQCAPTCGCGDAAWHAPVWTPESLARLQGFTQLDPPGELAADPYALPPSGGGDGAVCAVRIVDEAAKTYRLETFPSDAAIPEGALLTHHDACGLCSSLADLAVYAKIPDLTTPVRQCGLDTAAAGLEANVACLEGLGFTKPCAQVWAYNTANTRKECFATCVALLDAPYQEPDGSLNACLQCDEDQSGPVFKAVAGRTRRNTGIASALCRPCNEVHRIAHGYAF